MWQQGQVAGTKHPAVCSMVFFIQTEPRRCLLQNTVPAESYLRSQQGVRATGGRGLAEAAGTTARPCTHHPPALLLTLFFPCTHTDMFHMSCPLLAPAQGWRTCIPFMQLHPSCASTAFATLRTARIPCSRVWSRPDLCRIWHWLLPVLGTLVPSATCALPALCPCSLCSLCSPGAEALCCGVQCP